MENIKPVKIYNFEHRACSQVDNCPCEMARSIAETFRQAAKEHGHTTKELFAAFEQVLEQSEDI